MASSEVSRTVSATATARLKQDYMRLCKDPVPYVKAVPLPSNILTWYYVVTGPENTPYEGGLYFGRLVFPRDFPFKPPAIYMITPNGRFKVNQKLCLSISDFHPDTWNPAWSVSTILTGLLSFMVENTPTSGSYETSDSTKRRLAQESFEFNMQDKLFCELFPDIVDDIKEMKKRKELEKQEAERIKSASLSSSCSVTNDASNNLNLAGGRPANGSNLMVQNQSWLFSVVSNMFVMIGLAVFAYVVKNVFEFS